MGQSQAPLLHPFLHASSDINENLPMDEISGFNVLMLIFDSIMNETRVKKMRKDDLQTDPQTICLRVQTELLSLWLD